ncbi:unnamed protein product [Thelazia callipaeda]|uniref:Erythroid differentiation-related factor 1 n=1 Tax=Thelazia callipaeda TaxID=103827 RepID=A0A0N5D010_THECL|nr:unnamed protein product [Thelazia callipaeda]
MAATSQLSTSVSTEGISNRSVVTCATRPILCLPSTAQPIPLPVLKLEMNTNLNIPPLNAWCGEVYNDFWTKSSKCHRDYSGKFSENKSYTKQWWFNARNKDCFESLRLSDCYIDAIVGGIDVVAEAETLKKLIAAPFSKQPLNLIVHKIGKTLLLDNCAYLKNYSYTNKSSGSSSVAAFLNSKSRCLVGTDNTETTTGTTTGEIIADMHRKMIAENLYTRSLAPLDYKTVSEPQDDLMDPNMDRVNEASKAVSEVGGLVDPLENYPYCKIVDDGRVELDAYGRLWNFYDLNMLVDINLPIFGCKSNPCVTLHPKDLKHRPINFLTGVDLYLDQSMCNAPEALLCWHLGGFEYELIRTEDIPHLENSKFDPLILRNVTENIIAFLQDKVAQEGHTYWLCHDRGDSDRESMLRLWDLTPLCGDLLEDSTANPFTLSVAILIYKVARNLMRRSAHKRPKRIANAAFRLLNVCLGIIDQQKHPQIVACVYYLLANLYLSYGDDAIKRSPGQEEELELSEPQWAYDDRWQREYGEEYDSYAAISIESLKKSRYAVGKRSKPPKLRTLPNCATKEDCCKEALEHCLEGLRYMDLFDQVEQESQCFGKPLPDPMSFIRDMHANIDHGREEADAVLKVDVRSLLFIRAGTAYRMLADSSFILSRYGRTLRFARVGLYCCLAVLTLNAGITSEHGLRNLATARALIPAMMCHIAEALGNIACSSLPIKDQAKADLKRCYRDQQIKSQALVCLNADGRPYSWAFPKTFDMPFHELLTISERAANIAISMCEKIAPMSLFLPTANAILYREELSRRLDTMQQYLAMDINVSDIKDDDNDEENCNISEPEKLVKRTVKTGKELLLQGISLFNSVNDHVNEAFLLSNIGQLYRLQLHCQMYFTDFNLPYDPEKEKYCVLQAIEYYQQALTAVDELQSIQIPLFESISKDLAGTYLTYAIRLQDNVQPGLVNSGSQKLAVEIREFLVRAQSAYTLIRDSSKCSPKMRFMADRSIVDILFRFGKLAQHGLVGVQYCRLSRKLKDNERQAVDHYLSCFNYVMKKIKGTTTAKSVTTENLCLQECMIALKAIVESIKCSDIVVRISVTDVRVKRARRSLFTLFITTQPLLQYLHETAAQNENFLVDLNNQREILHSFVEYGRTIVKDVLQYLMEYNYSTDLDLWKNIYRQLLQIETVDRCCNISQFLTQISSCAKYINNCFKKL